MFLKTIVCTLFIVSFSCFCISQPKGHDFIIGQSFSLYSDILKEERPYLIYLPQDYDENGAPLPVMYLLDGDGHFHHTTGVISFLKNNGKIPNFMVVAIPNTSDRTRDLTPEIELNEQAAQQFPTAGGADNMLAFLKNELIPHIDQTYNTAPFKLLTGHSFGGLFAVHALLEEPDLFSAYIAISPSMWWDDQNLVKKAEDFLKTKPQLDCFFYMTMGNEGGTMLGGAMKLAGLFEEMEQSEFNYDFRVMEEETHGSIPHRSTYYGLEAIFEDWYSIDYRKVYSQMGLEGIKNHFKKISDKLGAYPIPPPENALNTLGYWVMGNGNIDEAINIFEQNIEYYPNAFNVYDSAGEAYMNKGDKEKAIAYYKKSMVLNPGNKNGVEMLKKLDVIYDPKELAIRLSPSRQKKFEGAYEVSVGGVLTIQIEDGELTASHPGIPKLTLLSYPNDLFLFIPGNIPVQFEMNRDNIPVKFYAQMGNGVVLEGKRKMGTE